MDVQSSMVLMSLRCFTLVVVVGISSATIMLCSPVLIFTNLKCMCYVVCNPLHSCSMNCSFEETYATSLCSTLYLRVHKLVPSFHKLLLHLRALANKSVSRWNFLELLLGGLSYVWIIVAFTFLCRSLSAIWLSWTGGALYSAQQCKKCHPGNGQQMGLQGTSFFALL